MANDRTLEGDELLKDLHDFTEVLTGTLSRTIEAFFLARADDDAAKAMKAWVIFSGVMILDFADAALALSRAGKRRGIQPLSRSLYEFFITLAYFERHNEFAVQQLQTIGGRRLLRASTGPYATRDERDAMIQRFNEWKEEAKIQKLEPLSGNRNFKDMALEVEDETTADCPSYSTRYGIPSMFSHPDAAAIPDVLQPVEGGGIRVAWHSETMDLRLLMSGINDVLVRTIMLLRDKFDASPANFAAIFERYEKLNHRVLLAKGIDPDAALAQAAAQRRKNTK